MYGDYVDGEGSCFKEPALTKNDSEPSDFGATWSPDDKISDQIKKKEIESSSLNSLQKNSGEPSDFGATWSPVSDKVPNMCTDVVWGDTKTLSRKNSASWGQESSAMSTWGSVGTWGVPEKSSLDSPADSKTDGSVDAKVENCWGELSRSSSQTWGSESVQAQAGDSVKAESESSWCASSSSVTVQTWGGGAEQSCKSLVWGSNSDEVESKGSFEANNAWNATSDLGETWGGGDKDQDPQMSEEDQVKFELYFLV